jgi:membrane protease YdiL (CAAX protease family)
MISNSTPRRSILAFFLVAGVLYAPVAFFAGVKVFPNVSLFNLAAFIPVTAALILVFRENKLAGIRDSLKRTLDFRRIESKVWYFPIFLLYPGIVLVQYGIALVSGSRVPTPTFSAWISVIIIVFFIAAAGEEIGWMGYLFDPMEKRFGTLNAAVLMGIVWAAFHIPLFVSSGASPSWIAWQLVYIAATRVLLVWVYGNTSKSVFAVIAMHATFNLGWQFFPPSAGLLVPTFYDPRNLALTTLVILAAVLFLWGPSLTRYRNAKASASG